MIKVVGCALTALFLNSSSLTWAQTAGGQDRAPPSQSDLKALTDARVGIVKAALQLTPEQEKLWPALEQAIRTRSAGRQQRLSVLASKLSQQSDVDAFELLRLRADNMAQRAGELQKLVDAWQPLWTTLNPDQKRRMAILAAGVLNVVRGTAESRQMEMNEDEED